MSAESAKTVLLVLGGKSFRHSDSCRKLKSSLSAFEVQESQPVGENPKIQFVEEFVESYRALGIDAVVGIGGGSVIDVAKMAAKSFAQKRPKLIAVPTTSGTGSEVTPYVSLETREKKKITVTDDAFFPDWAIVDPLLCESMPPFVTASTGMDALSQSIEAFWSVHHTPFSDAHALRSVSLVVPNIRRVVSAPRDNEARFAMALGSCESGLAIAQTATTAVHAVSYPITTYFDVPHGHACALTLAEFLRFNEGVMKEDRYADLWKAMNVRSALEAADAVEKMMNDIGLERRLSQLGVDMEVVIEHGFRPDRVKNNPRELTPEALRDMLRKIS